VIRWNALTGNTQSCVFLVFGFLLDALHFCVELFLDEAVPGAEDALQFESQSFGNERKRESQADFAVEQLVDELVDIGELVPADAVPDSQLAVVDVEGLHNFEHSGRLEGKSQVKQSKGIEIFVVFFSEVDESDVFGQSHLQHFEEEAEELGRLFGASVQSPDAFQQYCLVDEGFCVEGKALLLPVATAEYSVAGGLVDQLRGVLHLHQ